MPVTVGDAVFYVERHGQGPDLVMLHGMGASSTRVWDPVMPALAADYRVTTYDLRGHGRSTNPSGVQAVAQHAADLLDLFDHFGIGRAHLLGFSFTGLVVQQFALDHPERVRSLILVGTSAGIPPELHHRILSRVEQIEGHGMAAYADQQMALAISSKWMESHPDEAAWYREQYLANDPMAYGAAMRAMISVSFQDRLPQLRCPTLIVSGDDDGGLINSGKEHLGGVRELNRLIAGSELAIVPGSNHYAQLEQPEAFVAAVRGFLARV